MHRFLEPTAIDRIERAHPTGLSAAQIVELFAPLDARLSRATLRRYVQLGLLPRSRRVGTKGKHKGSKGVYPVGAVRRINVIKRMMAEGITLEEIRRSFIYFRNEIDQLELALGEIFRDLERELRQRKLPARRKSALSAAFHQTRASARELVRRIERIGSQIAASGAAFPPPAGRGATGT